MSDDRVVITVTLTRAQAQALVSQPKNVKPHELGQARAPIRAALRQGGGRDA